MAPLTGCTADGLAGAVADQRAVWAFQSRVNALKSRPALIITSDDGLTDLNDAFVTTLRQAGNAQVTILHLPTDHSYSDRRIELSRALIQWLAPLAK